jgi:hypothetical protein
MSQEGNPLRAVRLRQGGLGHYLWFRADSFKTIDLPKYTSPSVSRLVERHCQTYTRLAKAYAAKEWAAVQSIGKEQVFRDVSRPIHIALGFCATLMGKDRVVGLVNRLTASIPKRRIIDASHIYERMTVADLADVVEMGGEQGTEKTLTVLKEMVSCQSAIRAEFRLTLVRFRHSSPLRLTRRRSS